MGWRTTAQNLNLNRDYMKADALEMQAWLKLYNEWLPDFFIDCHVTDGADFQYVVTYGIETHKNVSPPVRKWVKGNYLPRLTSTLAEAGTPIVPYVFFRDDHDPMKGLEGGVSPPRFSTGYTVLHNRPGLLIETHMLKDYRTRVHGTYKTLEATLKLLNEEYKALKNAIAAADKQTTEGLENPFPLSFQTMDTPSGSVHFLGFKSRIEKSDLSGSEWLIYTNEPFEADIPRYDSVKPVKEVSPPTAYFIPREWEIVIERMKLHGIRLEQLTSPLDAEVESYRFSNAQWQRNPFEGRHLASYSLEKTREKRSFPIGTIVARVNQPAARVLINLLEPDAPDAFAAWGFFDAVFEQKEYAEAYVMEKVGRRMLESDPALRQEFESKLKSDTAFANSPSARLRFFYQKSPYWDERLNLYPIHRMMSDMILPTKKLQ